MRLELLTPVGWRDYELLDSGDGLKLERFGPYRFIRPEPQAIWRPALQRGSWESSHGTFRGTPDAGSKWFFTKKVEPRWTMEYALAAGSPGLKFWAQPTPSRQMGVFPEQAVHWVWLHSLVQAARRPLRVLNLFAYTGLATLAASAAGAHVTHVDASKKAVSWASENHKLSGLEGRPVRWIVDDVMKFVRREARRGAKYDGLVLDPPKYGRGAEGELWQIEKSLPDLLGECRRVLVENPAFLVLTCYAVQLSPVSLANMVEQTMEGLGGQVSAGETANLEGRPNGRLLAASLYARWQA